MPDRHAQKLTPLRGADDHSFVIAGPEQAPSQNCQELLDKDIFKDQLAKFQLKEWQEDHYGAKVVSFNTFHVYINFAGGPFWVSGGPNARTSSYPV